MNFNVSDALFILVLFLLFFLSVVLLVIPKHKPLYMVLLGCFFLALALNLSDSFLLLKGVYYYFPSLALWGSNLLLVCGPLLYFYATAIMDDGFKIRLKEALHFIPFVLLFAVSEIAYLSAGHRTKLEILENITTRHLPAAFYGVAMGIYVHFVIYLVATLQYLKQYSLVPGKLLPGAAGAALKWLRSAVFFFLVLVPLLLGSTYLSYSGNVKWYYIVLTLTVFLLLAFTTRLFFLMFRNPHFLERERSPDKVVNNPNQPINATELQQILERLLIHMREQQPYLQPSITLEELSAQVKARPKLLSQAINTLRQQTFFEFINEYRIEEAKRMLTNPADKKITIMEVMYQVGFNSKSSFNTLFKKSTGLTPGDFKRNHLG